MIGGGGMGEPGFPRNKKLVKEGAWGNLGSPEKKIEKY
jgi:hypothetical protein